MKRQIWEWLILVLWVVMVVVLSFRSWVLETNMLIEITGLIRPLPYPSRDWWMITTNTSLLLILIGLLLFWWKHYGVIVGLSLFVIILLYIELLL